MNRKAAVLLGILGLVLLAGSATAWNPSLSPTDLVLSATGQANADLQPPPPAIADAPVVVDLPIRSGDTLDSVLRSGRLDPGTSAQVIAAITAVFDARRFRAGSAIQLIHTPLHEPVSLLYPVDADHELKVHRNGDTYSASIEEIPSISETIPVCATLNGSLFESIEAQGESPLLALKIAEIFAWDIDFYTDPQPGDQFCFLVEKKRYMNGNAPTYGRIQAAVYVNGTTTHDAYAFPDDDGTLRYYSKDGKSLQAAFLRSPLKFAARVSSHFSHRRFHPVLKIHRPHLGTDYAAPTGTPVQAVASGRVTFSGYSGGAGNLVKVQHANGFETMYMHLSRRSVKRGDRVNQGDRIGLVGSTGLSTGPHLDFRIRKNGRYMNFEKMKLPREKQLASSRLEAFHQTIAEVHKQMPVPGETLPRSEPALATAVTE